MRNRILDLAEEPATLSLDLDRVRIERVGRSDVPVPISHLSVIVCSQRQATFTQALLARMSEQRVGLIVSNQKYQPVGMLLPLIGHSEQTARFQVQAQSSQPLRKRLWRLIISARILAQSEVLKRIRGESFGIDVMAGRVKLDNASAMEATASRHYWSRLFTGKKFVRHDVADARNGILDYGYAILRAITARAICGAGLHPGLGIHHHNRYDPFPLANDLMEPYRPIVDEWVAACWNNEGDDLKLDRGHKAGLLSLLTGRFTGDGERRTLFDWIERSAEQLTRCLEKKQKNLEWPLIRTVEAEDSDDKGQTTE